MIICIKISFCRPSLTFKVFFLVIACFKSVHAMMRTVLKRATIDIKILTHKDGIRAPSRVECKIC